VFRWVWLLHCLTLYCLLLGFVAAAAPRREGRTDPVLLFVLAAGAVGILGPIWMFSTPLVHMSLRSFTALFWNTVGSIIGCILVCLLVLARRSAGHLSAAERVLQLTVPMLYLAVSEVILYTTAHSPAVGVGLVLAGMALSYIPFRLLMIFTPPRSALEAVTASAALAYFIYQLL
jgi:hypothetical protein